MTRIALLADLNNLGDLYRAVEAYGGIPITVLDPSEDLPDYVGEILFAESRFEARGDSHEAATVAVINKVNEEARSR